MNSAFSLPFPSAVGSLESYIQSVNASRPVAAAGVCFGDALQGRERSGMRRASWCSPNLRVVVSVARGYAGYGLPQADLIQEGNIGLMKAVKRYDPDRGVRLVSFALHWIRAEIHEFVVRNWRLVKIRHHQGATQAVLQSAQHEAGVGVAQAAADQRDCSAAQCQRARCGGDGNAFSPDMMSRWNRVEVMTMRVMPRSIIWPTMRSMSRRAYWKQQSVSACKHPVWRMPWAAG